jgi:formate/nitrite transporter FocA (FNT family)
MATGWVAHGAPSSTHCYPAFTLPAFIGNTIGGVVLVALLAHAQVNAGED